METKPIPFSSEHFSLYPLADGVYAAIASEAGAAIANAGIIDLGDRTVLFDTFLTPQAGRDLLRAARQLTDREPQIIVNSHYHNDHIWGNQAFSDSAHIVSTEKTRRLIQTAGQEEFRSAREDSAQQLEEFRKKYETAQDERQRREDRLWLRYYQALVDNAPDLRVRLPDITFQNRLKIHGSSRTVELIPFERAHSGDDSILYLCDENIIFAADLLFVNYHPFLAEGDPDQLTSALHQISSMSAKMLVPGHGFVGTSQDIESNIEYISMCVNIAKQLVAEGDTSWERIARQSLPEEFSTWHLSRFFEINMKSLAGRFSKK
ncbi:MAG TPA: MBL fold metallo-hydrolase [Anaerolineales bacterium]|nr:MBL fold metallo-hydrolase [Anaerolineales bacterium]